MPNLKVFPFSLNFALIGGDSLSSTTFYSHNSFIKCNSLFKLNNMYIPKKKKKIRFCLFAI